MDLSPNEIRFLRKLAKQGGKEVRPFALADETESDWEAFPSLKDRGLVRGYSTKDGIAACLSENGKEVLVQATPFRRMRAWVAARSGSIRGSDSNARCCYDAWCVSGLVRQGLCWIGPQEKAGM